MWIIWPQNFEAPQLLASRMLTMHNKCWRKALSLSPIQPPRLDSKSPTNPPWFNEPLPLLYEIYRYLYTECTAVWWAQFPPKKQRYRSCPIYLANNYPPIFFLKESTPQVRVRVTSWIISIGFHSKSNPGIQSDLLWSIVDRFVYWRLDWIKRGTEFLRQHHCDMLHWLPFGRHIFLGRLRCPVTLV